tara:strand:- start:1689 stop:3053 length:1365 start_codon:yes stop_codon:yes gene_type:complete
MSYTIEQEPVLVIGTGQPIIFTAKESALSGSPKFKYICDIYINGTRKARLKQLPNASSVAVFDISRVVNSFLSSTKVNQGITTNSIHTLPLGDTADPFSLNDSTLESVVCKFGYEKASSATTAPVVEADVITESTRYAIQGAVPYIAGINYAFGDFIPNGTSKRFLTNMPNNSVDGESISVSNNEWRTIAFLNYSSATQINRLYVQIYNSSDVLLNTSNFYFENTNANGGANPSSEVSDDTERLIYAGIGVKNLNTQTLHTDMQISQHPTAAYYKVFGTDASNNQKTAKYRFNLDGNDCIFPMVELAWKNRLGVWDYYTFKKKDEKRLSITRTGMSKVFGTYNTATYSVNSFDRGGETLTTEAMFTASANTDYMSEKQAQWLQGCFTSNEVYLIDTTKDVFQTSSGATISADAPNVIPIEITSAEFTEKTRINNQCEIQYTINYKYSKPQRTGI